MLLYIAPHSGTISVFLIFLSKGVIVIKPSKSLTQLLDKFYDLHGSGVHCCMRSPFTAVRGVVARGKAYDLDYDAVQVSLIT